MDYPGSQAKQCLPANALVLENEPIVTAEVFHLWLQRHGFYVPEHR